METGTMVILLNLESLYESLYDALNQVCGEVKTYFMVLYIVSYVILCALAKSGRKRLVSLASRMDLKIKEGFNYGIDNL